MRQAHCLRLNRNHISGVFGTQAQNLIPRLITQSQLGACAGQAAPDWLPGGRGAAPRRAAAAAQTHSRAPAGGACWSRAARVPDAVTQQSGCDHTTIVNIHTALRAALMSHQMWTYRALSSNVWRIAARDSLESVQRLSWSSQALKREIGAPHHWPPHSRHLSSSGG